MTYSSPSEEQVRDWSGVNISVLNISATALAEMIDEAIENAEAEVAGNVTASVFESTTLTVYEVRNLQQAVAYGAVWRLLVNPKVRTLTGTAEPLLFETSEAFDQAIADFQGYSKRFSDLVSAGEGTADTGRIQHSFDSTTDALRTFTRAQVW